MYAIVKGEKKNMMQMIYHSCQFKFMLDFCACNTLLIFAL